MNIFSKTLVLLVLVANALMASHEMDKNMSKSEYLSMLPQELRMNYAKEYILNGNGKYTPEVQQIVLTDEDFKIANEYLNNPDKFDKRYINLNNISDRNSSSPGGKTFRFPNYNMALQYLSKSIERKSNPVSAYEFRYIIKTLYSKAAKKEYLALMLKVMSILYQNDVCESFIDYGKMLEDSNKDEEALAVYVRGKQICSKNTWIANVLAGREAYIQKLKHKNKVKPETEILPK